jgi:hypothetical protein
MSLDFVSDMWAYQNLTTKTYETGVFCTVVLPSVEFFLHHWDIHFEDCATTYGQRLEGQLLSWCSGATRQGRRRIEISMEKLRCSLVETCVATMYWQHVFLVVEPIHLGLSIRFCTGARIFFLRAVRLMIFATDKLVDAILVWEKTLYYGW